MATSRVAPAHLSARSQKLFRSIRREYALEAEPHALEVLRLALEALDRADEAREILARDGLTYLDSRDNPRPHPCVAIERDSRLAAVRCFRELSLDGGESYDTAHMPRVGGGS